MSDVRITWNQSKEQANKRKHRIGFDEAATVFTDPFIAARDDPNHSFYEYRSSRLVSQQEDGCSLYRILSTMTKLE